MREHVPRSELDEMSPPDRLPTGRFDLVRDARLFSHLPAERRRLEGQRRIVKLARSQLLRPPVPCDAVVRLGQLRVSEFLPDGREVTRAVLQAGSCFRTHETRGAHALADIVIMAFDEAEVWLLPAGSLAGLFETG